MAWLAIRLLGKWHGKRGGPPGPCGCCACPQAYNTHKLHSRECEFIVVRNQLVAQVREACLSLGKAIPGKMCPIEGVVRVNGHAQSASTLILCLW